MHLAESATANIVYTEEIAAIVGRNVDPGKIFVARNTLDTRTLFRLYDALTGEATTNAAEAKAAKALVRERIGLPSDGTIVAFIGRLIEEKGVGLLVESVARLAERRPNGATLLVIGDGPLRERLEGESESKGVKSVFTGALPILSDSAPYLFASDLLLNPGYLGLSVVHAFSLGVPVVAPLPQGDVRFHSPEWIYVESGENGLLVDDATPQRFADAMLTVLTNQRRFSQSALEYARSHLRLESMVEGILDAIRFATGLPEAGGTHAA